MIFLPLLFLFAGIFFIVVGCIIPDSTGIPFFLSIFFLFFGLWSFAHLMYEKIQKKDSEQGMQGQLLKKYIPYFVRLNNGINVLKCAGAVAIPFLLVDMFTGLSENSSSYLAFTAITLFLHGNDGLIKIDYEETRTSRIIKKFDRIAKIIMFASLIIYLLLYGLKNDWFNLFDR